MCFRETRGVCCVSVFVLERLSAAAQFIFSLFQREMERHSFNISRKIEGNDGKTIAYRTYKSLLPHPPKKKKTKKKKLSAELSGNKIWFVFLKQKLCRLKEDNSSLVLMSSLMLFNTSRSQMQFGGKVCNVHA